VRGLRSVPARLAAGGGARRPAAGGSQRSRFLDLGDVEEEWADLVTGAPWEDAGRDAAERSQRAHLVAASKAQLLLLPALHVGASVGAQLPAVGGRLLAAVLHRQARLGTPGKATLAAHLEHMRKACPQGLAAQQLLAVKVGATARHARPPPSPPAPHEPHAPSCAALARSLRLTASRLWRWRMSAPLTLGQAKNPRCWADCWQALRR
jgi:hypothetical protein